MPAPITNENDALDLLKLKSAWTVDPALDEANELLPILRQCARAVIWEASKAYYIGAIIQPTAPNRTGHRYEVVRFDGNGVSSGTTEPSWPYSDNAVVTSGNLYLRECGPEYFNLWDVDYAAFLAWQLKIDKVSCQYDFKVGDSSDSMSQRIATFERQRDRYAPTTIG